MLKLFHKLIEAYTDVYKEKYRKDVQLETSVEWKKMKNMKDLVLEIVVDKRISELKKLSEEESTNVEIWSKFVGGNANEKHSGGVSSQDMDLLIFKFFGVHFSIILSFFQGF